MDWHVLTPTTTESLRTAFALDVLTGLSEEPKRLSSRWFYDDRGSELFEEIMGVSAYYPTRKETEIFTASGAEIAGHFQGEIDVVDLGAGDGTKAFILLRELVDAGVKPRYVPIDISEGAMASLYAKAAKALPDVPLFGVVGDYVSGLQWLAEQDERQRLVLFLGSNIGNFDKPRARGFLRRIWTALRPSDHMLVGFDLKKDIEALLEAYNDPEGITASFNLNLLSRINRELGGNFDVSRFRHYGTYNVFSGAMESYIVSLDHQTVRIDSLRQEFTFRPWEPIHTEFSYKYLPEDVDSLAAFTGFEIRQTFHDSDRWFCDSLWKVK